MNGQYTLLAFDLSMFSGKARAYLRYKQVPFVEKAPNAITMMQIPKKVGVSVVPVLITPQGRWLMDTSRFIDHLETRFPKFSVIPNGSRQKLAASMLEAWGDEGWYATIMHYRWNFPDSVDQFQRELGDDLLPKLVPRPVKDKAAGVAMNAMQRFLPGLGIVPQQLSSIEAWTEKALDLLEAHFAEHDYLLGGRPCVGDFGLIGGIYAHLYHDAYPRQALMRSRPNLTAWVERMQHPNHNQLGEWLEDDAIPATLTAVLKFMLTEFMPYLQKLNDGLVELASSTPAGQRFPRQPKSEFTIPRLGEPFTCSGNLYALWMWQRAQDVKNTLSSAERESAASWLQSLGHPEALSLPIEPRLEQVGLRVRAA